ncbi:DUF6864 domain-containing function [Tumebacillus flagellatus]|uniref:Uncharacterized protein n=1 Tax=Tumebacillus flagellatus TaxID=1157490 RepID=A0A074LXI3_9BACL|nr:hypothetical protein EL26_00770 [Tumebacillus flagellatus]
MDLKVKVGEYQVLDSGSVMVFENETLEFALDDGDGKLTVRCVFEDREDEENGRMVEGEAKNDSECNLLFINFNNRYGTGSKKPIEVGIYNERKLLLQYYIAAPKSSYKVFTYTWYLGKVVRGSR